MSDIEFEETYLVTFRPDEFLKSASNIRSITLAATTTDPEDARVLAWGDLTDEFGVEVSKHFIFVSATVE